MEYLAHGTLEDHLGRKALPEPEAKTIIGQVAQALQYMHDLDFIHRDMKPAVSHPLARISCKH